MGKRKITQRVFGIVRVMHKLSLHFDGCVSLYNHIETIRGL